MMRPIWRWGLVLMGSSGMVAQAPLIKPGLWEITTVRNNDDAPPFTGKGKMCLTAADGEKMLHPVDPKMPDCTVNVKTGAHNMTLDMTCTGKVPMRSRASTTIVDDEHIDEELEVNFTPEDGATHHIVERDSSRFLSADCGKIRPGERPVVE